MSPFSICSGVSILMTSAPQSASWRTQVGPERTRVRSSTVKRVRALEARGERHFQAFPKSLVLSIGARHSPISKAL